MKKISENTSISITLVIAFVGGVAYVTAMAGKVDTMEGYFKDILDAITDVKQRIAKIEGKLENK